MQTSWDENLFKLVTAEKSCFSQTPVTSWSMIPNRESGVNEKISQFEESFYFDTNIIKTIFYLKLNANASVFIVTKFSSPMFEQVFISWLLLQN